MTTIQSFDIIGLSKGEKEMKIMIEIDTPFLKEFKKDRFKQSFERVIETTRDDYAKETMYYLRNALLDAIEIKEEKQKRNEEWNSETMCGQFYENDEGIKAQMKTDDEIKVGDGVVSVFGKHGYVTGIDKDELYVLYPNGEVGHSSTNTYVKDGRYFSRMTEILKQMEGEND